MDSRFQIFGAKITPDIRSGFLRILTGPETILPDMSGGPTDFREDCYQLLFMVCGSLFSIVIISGGTIHQNSSETQYLYHDLILRSTSLQFDMIRFIAVWQEIIRNFK